MFVHAHSLYDLQNHLQNSGKLFSEKRKSIKAGLH